MKSIYLAGSMRNTSMSPLANRIERELGIEMFDSWRAPGPEADDWWKRYETSRGRKYEDALHGHMAKCIFDFDKSHLDRTDGTLIVLPAGKSAHIELGYTLGRGKPGFVLMDTPDRWDVMYQFATHTCFSEDTLIEDIRQEMKNRGF